MKNIYYIKNKNYDKICWFGGVLVLCDGVNFIECCI